MKNQIITVVIGLIQKEDLFLIAKRPEHVVMPDYWEFPGGKVEPGEDQFSALSRELEEEIDITVTRAEHLTQYQAIFSDKTLELNLWRINDYLKTPRGNEGQAIRWASRAQFSDYEFLPSNKTLLTFIQNMR